MIDNIVDLFPEELKHCSYYELDDEIGVAMLDKSIIVLPLNFKEFEFVLNGESHVFKRKELAEFLHVAALLVDSEQRYVPEIDLLGHNYK